MLVNMRHRHLLAVAFIAAIASSCAQEELDSSGSNKSGTTEPGGSNESGTKEPGGSTAATDGDVIANLRAGITELEGRTEHTASRIVVQHILIGFKGSVSGKSITRTRDEAEALAAQLFSEIQNGADFDALVKKHTDDSYPGRYPMTAAGRRQMVQGFGDVGWRLEVGKVGVAPHHDSKSPFGWHLIKRVE